MIRSRQTFSGLTAGTDAASGSGNDSREIVVGRRSGAHDARGARSFSLAQRHGVANSDQTAGGLDRAEDAHAAPMMFRAGPEHAEIPGKVALCQGRRHAPEGGLHAVDPQSPHRPQERLPATRLRRSQSTRPRSRCRGLAGSGAGRSLPRVVVGAGVRRSRSQAREPRPPRRTFPPSIRSSPAESGPCIRVSGSRRARRRRPWPGRSPSFRDDATGLAPAAKACRSRRRSPRTPRPRRGTMTRPPGVSIRTRPGRSLVGGTS